MKDRKCLFIIVLAPCSPAAGELYLQESAVHFRESIHGRSGWEPTFERDRRYPLTSALSVCRASAFSASLVHSSNISIPQNWNGSPQRAGTHTSRTAWALCGSRGRAATGHGLHRRPAWLPAVTLCTLSLYTLVLAGSVRGILTRAGVGTAQNF